uniref:GDSL esterase/lipase n=1 Tax=Kalanchoe fedtschenkoi TaxID=63787 RepID=A0A7N0UQA2_KALFE
MPDVVRSCDIIRVLIICLLTIKTRSVSSTGAPQPDKATFAYEDHKGAKRSRVSAIFVFGDSTVDPGNNNFLVTEVKSNFPPYGHSFMGGRPTGRFTDGRLVTDFIGLKDYIPPYLDPTLSLEELKTGVSFASAASGYDPLTATLTNVLPISSQLEYFREYKAKMEKAVGKTETDNIIRNSAIVISAGTNDFILNYLTLPVRQETYSISEYQEFLISQLEQLLQALIEEGARKFGVVGLPPLGCLPFVITLFSKDHHLFAAQECIDSLSLVAKTYNDMLRNRLNSKRYQLEGIKVAYADIYNPAYSIVQNPKKFGFQEVFEGCCGTGIIEASYLCNPESPLCSDVSKYVFFDAVHPTERTYYLVFESLKHLVDTVVS